MTHSAQSNHGQNQSPTHDSIDLSHFDDFYANTDVQKRNFEEVPDGKYQVIVNKAELTRAKESKKPCLMWELKILGPTQKGRLLWRTNAIATNANVKWLKTDLYTCGLQLEKLSDLHLHLDALLDVKLEVTKRSRGKNKDVFFNKRIITEDIDGTGEHDAPPAQSWEQF